MKHKRFSIKICHSSSIYCNSVCPGESKLRELSLNHSQLTTVGSGSGRVKCETNVFVAGCAGRFFFLGGGNIGAKTYIGWGNLQHR